jgi:radical SAM protein with 4Fe4S-binding SPASM domain
MSTVGVASLATLEAGAGVLARDGHMPHVVAWNLTRRCNLECAHCYISAGPSESASDELTTAECQRITDEILSLNASPMFILSGGEPLLRDDLCAIASYATRRGATVVVGTNGTLLTDDRIAQLQDAGVTGVAVSIDSLSDRHHDNFRHGAGARVATVEALARLRAHRLDFIIQTTAHRGNRDEIAGLVDWAADQGAVSFNLYFLVATGRGARLTDLTPEEYEALLAELVDHQRRYRGRMMVRAKCAPHFMRHLHRADPDSPILNYSTRCPCGVQYCRITPDGKLTPCPYLPTPAGDLRRASFGDIWRDAPLFHDLRSSTLGGKCGRCEYRQVCGGCRARAFALEGDVLAADPSCAYEPDGTVAVIASTRPVSYGMAATVTMTWSPDARARIDRIPSFVRGVVVSRLETYARERGLHEVTVDLLSEVRRAMPIDFSKRLPFFASDD